MSKLLHKSMLRIYATILFSFVLQAHSKDTYCSSGVCTLPESEYNSRIQESYLDGIRRGLKIAGRDSDCSIYIVQGNGSGGSSTYERAAFWSVYKKELGSDVGIEMYYHPKQMDPTFPEQYIFRPKKDVLEWKDAMDQTWNVAEMGNDLWRGELGKVNSGFVSFFENLNKDVLDAMVVGQRYAFVSESQCSR